MPTRPAPTRLSVCSDARVGQRGGGRGQVPQRRPEPGRAGRREPPGEAGPAGGVGRVVRRVRVAQVAHHADHPDGAGRSASRAARHSRAHSAGRGSVAGHPDVEVQVHPERDAGRQAGARDRAQVGLARHRDVDVLAPRLVEVGVRRVEPAEHRRPQPASRRANASSRLVTPSHEAPCASAVRATSTAPWPNPSALTTAISAPGVRAAKSRVLARDRGEVDVAAVRRARRGPGGERSSCRDRPLDRAVERGGRAGDQRPVAVAVRPVPPLGRVVDQAGARRARRPAARGGPGRRRRCRARRSSSGRRSARGSRRSACRGRARRRTRRPGSGPRPPRRRAAPPRAGRRTGWSAAAARARADRRGGRAPRPSTPRRWRRWSAGERCPSTTRSRMPGGRAASARSSRRARDGAHQLAAGREVTGEQDQRLAGRAPAPRRPEGRRAGSSWRG